MLQAHLKRTYFLCFVRVRLGNRTRTIVYAVGTSGVWPVSKQSVLGSCPTKQFCTSWPLCGQKGAEEKKICIAWVPLQHGPEKQRLETCIKRQCPGSNKARSTRRNVGSQVLKYNTFSNLKSEVSPSRRHHYIFGRWTTYRSRFLDVNTMPCSKYNIIFSPDAGFLDGFDKLLSHSGRRKIESKQFLSAPLYFFEINFLYSHPFPL